MPSLPARLCREQPCANREPCPKHPREERRDPRSSSARGYGAEHRRLRRQVLREEPWCPGFPPGVHGTAHVPTTVMDHIVSMRRGGTTSRGNTRGLCASCNRRKAVEVEGARPRRRTA